MKWFRLWHEWGHDPKVQAMPEVMQRRHVMLLCLRRQVDTSQLSDEEIAHYMRLDMQALKETKQLFEKKGFIDNGWDVLAWEKRNPISDSAADRMRKYRERKKKKESDVTETSRKRNSYAIDKIRIDKKSSAFLNQLWLHYPRRQHKKQAFSKLQTLLKKGTDQNELLKATKNYKKAMAGKENRYIQLASTFFGPNGAWEEWTEGSPEGFNGVFKGPPAEDPHANVRCKRCLSWWSTMERNEEGLCERCAEAVSSD